MGFYFNSIIIYRKINIIELEIIEFLLIANIFLNVLTIVSNKRSIASFINTNDKYFLLKNYRITGVVFVKLNIQTITDV